MKTEAKPGLNDVMYLLALLACCVASSALAGTYYWDNNGSTADFGTASTVSPLTFAVLGVLTMKFNKRTSGSDGPVHSTP